MHIYGDTLATFTNTSAKYPTQPSPYRYRTFTNELIVKLSIYNYTLFEAYFRQKTKLLEKTICTIKAILISIIELTKGFSEGYPLACMNILMMQFFYGMHDATVLVWRVFVCIITAPYMELYELISQLDWYQ